MTLTLAQSIVVAILAFSTFFCGWFFYRLRAKAREVELQKVVLETKGMIPQLETTVRSREQRIAALLAESVTGRAASRCWRPASRTRSARCSRETGRCARSTPSSRC